MRIILEGPDGGGKTTLANKLAKKYGLEIIHMTRRDSMKFKHLSVLLDKDDVIWDRQFISEYVYSNVFNRPKVLLEEDYKNLFKKVDDLKIKILICLPYTYHLNPLEDRKIINKHVDIVNEYFRFAKKHSLIIIDPKTIEEEKLWKIIEN